MDRPGTLETIVRVAAIDIGTNTILLLIADVETDGSVSVIRDEQVIARLGRGVDAGRQIVESGIGGDCTQSVGAYGVGRVRGYADLQTRSAGSPLHCVDLELQLL